MIGKRSMASKCGDEVQMYVTIENGQLVCRPATAKEAAIDDIKEQPFFLPRKSASARGKQEKV